MRKVLLPLMISLSLLCGCADNGEESFNSFIEQTADAQSISFTADVQAEYSDKTAQFKLGYIQNGDDAAVEVIEPELVAGIKAKIKPDSLQLEYDGAVLDIGELTEDGLCPMSSLPLFVNALKQGHVDIVWSEDELTAARIIPSDDFCVTLWIDSELNPVNAEISYKEKTVVFIQITDWKAD